MLVNNKRRNVLKIAVSLFIFIIIGTAFLFVNQGSVSAQANVDQLAWDGHQAEVEASLGLPATDPRVVIAKIIRVFLGFLGIMAVVLIMYAGFTWMTSEGDESKIQKAKDTLKSAVIGLIIILSSFAIATFVLNMLTGGGSGGVVTQPPGGGPGGGYGSIGACTVQSVYPAPKQKDIPRNIKTIIVTFNEEVNLDTIMNTSDNIITDGRVKLYKTSEDSTNFIKNIQVVASTDHKTFTFIPDKYLGSPSEHIWYTMYLSNKIQKTDGNGIFDTCANKYLMWDFEVNNKIDLTPPQVLSGGVFPVPDKAKDKVTSDEASQATGTLVLNKNPQHYKPATAVYKNGSLSLAISDVNTSHNQSGALTVAVHTDGITALLSNSSNQQLGTAIINDNEIIFDGFFTLTKSSGDSFSAGDLWVIDTTPLRVSDVLTIGSDNYIFVSTVTAQNQIAIGANKDATASNIAASLEDRADLKATSSASTINLTAEIAGTSGNNIFISSSDDTVFDITPMSGGVNSNDIITIKDIKDKARNAIIQINFNEAIVPFVVSGDAETVVGKIFVECVSGDCSDDNFFFDCNTDNRCVRGEFLISNQYKTVEFQSNNKCGVNACGESIYCLPPNSKIKVGLVAANLVDCGTDNSCASKSPYNTCTTDKHCQNTDSKNYPLSTTDFDGLMDTAMNSLDGDRSGDSVGPISFYDQNGVLSGADSFQWSFFVNEKIELNPPVINEVGPTSTGADLMNPVYISFDKIMMSASLKTGSMVVSNELGDISHKMLNLWSISGLATGYWITTESQETTEPPNEEPDFTKAFINHSPLLDSMSYKSQAGSGVKDIYQNCFKPSNDKVCGAGADKPSCCNGIPTATLGVDGNCQ